MPVQETYMSCKGCKKSFLRRRLNKQFCSSQCYRMYRRSDKDVEEDSLGVCAGTVGTIHELLVSADLLKQGWSVFKSISPSCFCDLVAVKGDNVLLVQVTKARRRKTGVVTFASHKGERFDVLALSFASGEIQYRPELPGC